MELNQIVDISIFISLGILLLLFSAYWLALMFRYQVKGVALMYWIFVTVFLLFFWDSLISNAPINTNLEFINYVK